MRLALLLVVAVACGRARLELPNGATATCTAFGQARAVACLPGAHDRSSAGGAFVVGQCCDAHGGAVSPQTDSMWQAIGLAILSTVLGLATAGVF